MDFEEIWSAACCGNIELLEKYYLNGGIKNVRHQAFGNSHSLIMGAFRNHNFKTVKFLKSVGETIMESEGMEILEIYLKEHE